MNRTDDYPDYRIPNISNRCLTDPHVVIIGAGASKAACSKDKNGKSVPLLRDILKTINADDLLKKHNFSPTDIIDFEEFYSSICKQPQYAELCKDLESIVYDYFSSLEISEDINLYDYLLLSLTKKDLIISFNWDPFLLQAYLRNIDVVDLPQVSFPHGNVGVGVCYKCRRKGYYGYACPNCGKPFTKLNLLYPTGEKDYENDIAIKSEWAMSRDYLERAAGLTIFGYGAPVSDISAVKLLKEAFEASKTKVICPVSIINLMTAKDEQLEKWKHFYDPSMITYDDKFQDTILWKNPRVSLETLFDAILQQHPRDTAKPFHNFKTLSELQDFSKTITEFDLWSSK